MAKLSTLSADRMIRPAASRSAAPNRTSISWVILDQVEVVLVDDHIDELHNVAAREHRVHNECREHGNTVGHCKADGRSLNCLGLALEVPSEQLLDGRERPGFEELEAGSSSGVATGRKEPVSGVEKRVGPTDLPAMGHGLVSAGGALLGQLGAVAAHARSGYCPSEVRRLVGNRLSVVDHLPAQLVVGQRGCFACGTPV